MSDEEAVALVHEAFEDCFDLMAYARQMNHTPNGRLYLALLHEAAHNGLAWAQTRGDLL